LASLLIDDDGLVATAAVGEVVSGRLFVHDQCDVLMLIVVDSIEMLLMKRWMLVLPAAPGVANDEYYR